MQTLHDFYKAQGSRKGIEADFTKEYVRCCLITEFTDESDRRKKEITLALSLLKEAFSVKEKEFASLLLTVAMKVMPDKLHN